MPVPLGHVRVRIRATGQVINMRAAEARLFLNSKPPRVELVEDESIETTMLDRSRPNATAPAQKKKGRSA